MFYFLFRHLVIRILDATQYIEHGRSTLRKYSTNGATKDKTYIGLATTLDAFPQ